MNTHTFQTKLESNVIQLFDIGNLIGKEVIISIIEIPRQAEVKKKKAQMEFSGRCKSEQTTG